MMYTELEIGNNVYKLRLNTRNIVVLEKQLGCNPLSIFGSGDVIPPVTTMVAIFHAALQPMEHGITVDKAYDLFDEYLVNHTMTDFIQVIVDIYKVSGLIQGTDEKNA